LHRISAKKKQATPPPTKTIQKKNKTEAQ